MITLILITFSSGEFPKREYIYEYRLRKISGNCHLNVGAILYYILVKYFENYFSIMGPFQSMN